MEVICFLFVFAMSHNHHCRRHHHYLHHHHLAAAEPIESRISPVTCRRRVGGKGSMRYNSDIGSDVVYLLEGPSLGGLSTLLRSPERFSSCLYIVLHPGIHKRLSSVWCHDGT